MTTAETPPALQRTGFPALFFPKSKRFAWVNEDGQRLKGKQHPFSIDLWLQAPIQITDISTVAQ